MSFATFVMLCTLLSGEEHYSAENFHSNTQPRFMSKSVHIQFFGPGINCWNLICFQFMFSRFFLFQVLSGEEVGSEAAGAVTVFSGGGSSSSHRGTLLASFYGGLLWALLWGRLL